MLKITDQQKKKKKQHAVYRTNYSLQHHNAVSITHHSFTLLWKPKYTKKEL